MKDCFICGFYDSDYGCTCSTIDMWYACPIESKKPENQKELEEYAEWLDRMEQTNKNERV